MAKLPDSVYEPNKRTMFKVKHERDCDCVVAGFRWHKKVESGVGSLLLGLFNSEGKLQHVGVCSSFSVETRKELAEFLEPYRKNALRRPSLEGVGGFGRRTADAWRAEPLEQRQRSFLGTGAGGTGSGSGV